MAKKDYYRFRLTGGKTPASFQLPLKNLMLKKKDENGNDKGLKKVQYIPGHDSIFAEDHTGDEEPKAIWFEDGVLDVHKDNKPLVQIMFGHRWYKTHYELVDDNAAATKKLSKYDLIEKANTQINVATDDELRAIGLVLIGGGTIESPIAIIKANLKEMAYNDPQTVIDEMSNGDYHAKYTAALGLLKGIIQINPSRTAVTWPDGKTIVQVPAGQDPIAKIGQFLAGNDDQAMITLQEIGERTTRAYNKKKTPDVQGSVEKVLQNQKDDDVDGNSDGDTTGDKTMDLDEARGVYKELYGKDVSTNKKNDLDWIIGKINEAKSS